MRDDEEDYSKKVPYGFEDLFPECFEKEPAIENNLQNKARSQSVNPFLNINTPAVKDDIKSNKKSKKKRVFRLKQLHI